MFDDQFDTGDGGKPWSIPLGWRADNQSKCRSCGAEIMWCITPGEKRAPLNRDGTSHFATCPQAADWRQGGSRRKR